VSVTETADSAAVAAEEASLVARIASGDVGAPVAELYRRYGRRLYRFGMKQLGDEGLAEEMVQETFVRLWRTAGRFDAGKASVGTYLYVLARSAAADIYKRPSSRPLLSGTGLEMARQVRSSSSMMRVSTCGHPRLVPGGDLRDMTKPSVRTSIPASGQRAGLRPPG
jgi:Sigma-70 region 2